MSDEETYVPAAVESGGRKAHRKRRQLKVSYFFFLAIAAVIVTQLDASSLHLYSIAAMGLLAAKMLGALFYRPATAGREGLEYLENSWVTAVIPIYNEDPVTFEQGLRSLLAQSRLPNEIHIIDDASADPGGIKVAKKMRREFEARKVKYTVSVQAENKGKREALALGFQAAPYSDIFLCVDSDTVLSRDTVRELLLPLADERVMASTGMVLALNHNSNIFTRLQDLRYGNSFLFERAAYSRLKSVLCCCGALSAYRGTLVRKYLPDFLNQQFLGKPAVFGDDRRMTNYCLMEGQVVFQETAVGYTAVPEKLPHFLRQQVRWNKSFFRESLWAFTHQKKYRPAFWLTTMELMLWLVFGTAMLYSLVVVPILNPSGFAKHVGDYLIFMVLMGYLRNVRYLDFPRRGMGFIKRLGMFTLAPLYGVIQLTLLTPLRFYALLTLSSGSWGTRQGGVEVTAKEGGEEEVAEVWEEEDPYSSLEVSSTLEMMRLEGLALAKTLPPRLVVENQYARDGHHVAEVREEDARAPQQRVSWGGAPQSGPLQSVPSQPGPSDGAESYPQRGRQPAYGQQQVPVAHWQGQQQPHGQHQPHGQQQPHVQQPQGEQQHWQGQQQPQSPNGQQWQGDQQHPGQQQVPHWQGQQHQAAAGQQQWQGGQHPSQAGQQWQGQHPQGQQQPQNHQQPQGQHPPHVQQYPQGQQQPGRPHPAAQNHEGPYVPPEWQ